MKRTRIATILVLGAVTIFFLCRSFLLKSAENARKIVAAERLSLPIADCRSCAYDGIELEIGEMLEPPLTFRWPYWKVHYYCPEPGHGSVRYGPGILARLDKTAAPPNYTEPSPNILDVDAEEITKTLFKLFATCCLAMTIFLLIYLARRKIKPWISLLASFGILVLVWVWLHPYVCRTQTHFRMRSQVEIDGVVYHPTIVSRKQLQGLTAEPWAADAAGPWFIHFWAQETSGVHRAVAVTHAEVRTYEGDRYTLISGTNRSVLFTRALRRTPFTVSPKGVGRLKHFVTDCPPGMTEAKLFLGEPIPVPFHTNQNLMLNVRWSLVGPGTTNSHEHTFTFPVVTSEWSGRYYRLADQSVSQQFALQLKEHYTETSNNTSDVIVTNRTETSR